MYKWIALAIGLHLAGCGDAAQEFVVNGLKLTIKDGSYISKPAGYFCNAGGLGQIKMTLVDYKPACALDLMEGQENPRRADIEHTELELLIMNLSTHLNLMNEFKVGPADCDIGPVEEVQATFRHYAVGADKPDVTVNSGTGTLKLTQYSKTNQVPALGSFKVTIGQSLIDGTFDSVSCDPP